MASYPYSAEECPMARVVGPVTGQRLGIRMPQRAATRQGWLGAAGFLVRRPGSMIGGALTVLILVLALVGPMLAPVAPDHVDLSARLQGPSRAHIFGTDQFGRDVLSRLLHGARYSLLITLASVAVAMVLGTLAGTAAGYFGGWLDRAITHLMDILLALPSIFLALAVASAFGTGMSKVVLATALVGIPRVGRIARGSVIAVKQREFVEAARALGASNWRIQLRHVLPNCAGSLIVFATLWTGTTLIYASGLSFLGVGVQPPTPEWGAMLADAQPYLLRAPALALFPGLAITLLVLGLNLLGDGVRDYLDPGTRKKLQGTTE